MHKGLLADSSNTRRWKNPLLCIQLFKGQTENVWKIDGAQDQAVCRCHHVGWNNIGGYLDSNGVWRE